jgi:hypothetical protein
VAAFLQLVARHRIAHDAQAEERNLCHRFVSQGFFGILAQAV